LSAGTGVYEMVYDGELNPLQRQITVRNLITGTQYQFKVAAVNFNGESVMSDAVSTYACVAPSQPKKPIRVTGTTTTILLSWTPPADDGGCPIQAYKLWRDSGSPLSDIDVQVDPSNFDNKPFLNSYNVVLASSDTGKTYRFQIEVFNYEGTKTSNIATYIIATVPDKPANAPHLDVTQSDGGKLQIYIDELLDAESGGADIISYEIQIDDGLNGAFYTVLGGEEGYTLDSEITITKNIVKGRQYRLRYRAINLIGNGPWSDLAYVVASTFPKVPPKPLYTYVDNTKLDLLFTET
jgi:hypothetical protein